MRLALLLPGVRRQWAGAKLCHSGLPKSRVIVLREYRRRWLEVFQQREVRVGPPRNAFGTKRCKMFNECVPGGRRWLPTMHRSTESLLTASHCSGLVHVDGQPRVAAFFDRPESAIAHRLVPASCQLGAGARRPRLFWPARPWPGGHIGPQAPSVALAMRQAVRCATAAQRSRGMPNGKLSAGNGIAHPWARERR